jgi:integrase
MKGSTFKRCPCPTLADGAKRRTCKLAHGSWYLVADLPPMNGKRRQVKRGGFRTKTEADAALAEILDQAAKGVATHADRQTLAVYLTQWHADATANGILRPTTSALYGHHIRDYLVPHLGHVRLRDLRHTHVEHLLRELSTKPGASGRPLKPSSIRRVHSTLRSALSTATRKRLIPYNPARDVDLPSDGKKRVHPWEPEQLGGFLDAVGSDRLGALFELLAATGMRRGEGVGLRWADVDLERRRLVVRQQIIAAAHASVRQVCPVCAVVHKELAVGPPKTKSGEDKKVDLDQYATGALIAHRLRQDAERAAWGPGYVDHGLVFAREDGNPIPPGRVTKRFRELVKESGLRRVRLHDLRHGAASMRLAAGIDIAVVSKILGHSSIALTVDTYSHLLEGVGRDAADRASALVPRAIRDQSVTTEVIPEGSGTTAEDVSAGHDGGHRRTRTADFLLVRQAL